VPAGNTLEVQVKQREHRRTMKNASTRLIIAIALGMVLPLSAGHKPPELYFGGQRLTLGMHVSDVAAATSKCCKISPPLSTLNTGEAGHFITARDDSPNHPLGILGTVWFKGGKLSRISQPIDSDFDGYNEDVVRLGRALERALASTTGDSSSTLFLSVQHTRATNGAGDTISLSFPNGRGIDLQIITLDNPEKSTNKRDAVTLEEFLESPR
jgi:hypothetical protein